MYRQFTVQLTYSDGKDCQPVWAQGDDVPSHIETRKVAPTIELRIQLAGNLARSHKLELPAALKQVVINFLDHYQYIADAKRSESMASVVDLRDEPILG